jgi:hypothetical protein
LGNAAPFTRTRRARRVSRLMMSTVERINRFFLQPEILNQLDDTS